jgi:transcription elongation GreA/GreB family factor
MPSNHPARAYYLTPAGRARLQRRIDDARLAYQAVCATNEEAAGAGDSSVWHDNFAYEENQRQMHQLARRVTTLQQVLLTSREVPPRREAPARVQIGASVRIRRLADGRETTWFIAGWDDGDPEAGRISYTTPLASALLEAEVGDVRTVREGGAVAELEILAVLPAPPEEFA